MRAIFISYRRDDTEGQAGRLSDDLSRHFGKDAVFMDVSAIKPGLDFRRVIDEHVSTCGVLLTLIGPGWLTTTNEAGARRLDDPLDFVRLETGVALKRDIPVVPVLVKGAKMPRAEDLPDDLKELAFRNGVELTHQRWESDVEVLVKALRPYVQAAQPLQASTPAAAASGSPVKMIAIGVGGLVLAGAALLAWQQRAGPNPPPTQTIDKPLASSTSVAQKASEAAVAANVGASPAKPPPTATAPARPAAPTKPAPKPAVVKPAPVQVTQSKPEVVTPTPAPPVETSATPRALTAKDWEGAWQLRWEYAGKWFGPIPMQITSNGNGANGQYGTGNFRGSFVGGDYARVSGMFENTAGTAVDCGGGKQGGRFSFTMADDGKSMKGWWDLCGKGEKFQWRAVRL